MTMHVKTAVHHKITTNGWEQNLMISDVPVFLTDSNDEHDLTIFTSISMIINRLLLMIRIRVDTAYNKVYTRIFVSISNESD